MRQNSIYLHVVYYEPPPEDLKRLTQIMRSATLETKADVFIFVDLLCSVKLYKTLPKRLCKHDDLWNF